MTWYTKADEEVNATVEKVMKKYHPDLHAEGVLVVKKSKKTGAVERDDLDRPKLKMREHDYEFGWFAETAHRFGEDSFEFSQARELLASASWMQPLLPGIEDALSFEIEPQAVPAAAKPKRSRKKDMAVA
jgi:hypothetical protein